MTGVTTFSGRSASADAADLGKTGIFLIFSFPDRISNTEHWLVEFGPRGAEMQAILRFLEGYGVFTVDVNPGNVSFGD
jgi:hypothetical protein